MKQPFNIKDKLGLAFASREQKIAFLSEKMALGVQFESLVRSAHWPVLKALLDSKSDEAVHQLKQPFLLEKERVWANTRAAFIEELLMDISKQITLAQAAQKEIEKIKEKDNV